MNSNKHNNQLVVFAAVVLLALLLPLTATARDKPEKARGKNRSAAPGGVQAPQKLVQVFVPQYVEVPGYGMVIRYVPVLVPQTSPPVRLLGNGKPKGNNGVGNGIDPPPPGNPPINDGPGTGPGRPGNRGGRPAGK